MSAPLVCSIGTTEPWNVAGLGLDLRALAACGARAVTIVAGVSAQDGRGGFAGRAVATELIAAQFASLERAPIAAFRIGALLDAPSIASVAAALGARLRGSAGIPVVYDPVLAASDGGEFASRAAIDVLVRELVPLATVVTPNVGEASRLLGREIASARGDASPAEMAALGRALVGAGARGALVTGGDRSGDPLDVLVDAEGEASFAGPRLPGELRGTGCLLACALAAALARGEPLRDAVATARAFVRERFANAVEIGGMRAGY